MKRFEMKMEDATRYLPHDPTGRAYEWYVIDRERIDGLTKQPTLVMIGSKEDCERRIQQLQPTE